MARFLKDSDYSVQTRDEILDLLDNEPETPKILWAEKMAVSQMKKRLAQRYDVDTLFAPAPSQGDDPRDPFIVMCMVDVVLYHLWSGQAPGKIPEHRSLRYKDVLDWLSEVGTGKGSGGDMPELPAETYASDIRLISRKPVNHKY